MIRELDAVDDFAKELYDCGLHGSSLTDGVWPDC